MPLLECVPNFSEGRDRGRLDQIVSAGRAVPGVFVLDAEMDADHNRSVVTLAGEAAALEEAAFRMCAVAAQVIDLNHHQGEHPRMGATDVIPFVPLSGATMDDAVASAKRLGARIGRELKIPVFYYESAATRPERQALPNVRKGQFEGLRDLIGKDPAKEPDEGPHAIHPTAGATAVGARPFLIAYNVNLRTEDLALAKDIAKSVREKDGGFKGIRAMGFELKEKGCVQVSMNVTDYQATGLGTVYGDIAAKARAKGVEVLESELIGLIPQDALDRAAAEALRINGFKPDQIVEARLAAAQQASGGALLSASPFVDLLASSAPAPGGGSAAALMGAMAAALGTMVARLTEGKKGYEASQEKLPGLIARFEARRARLMALVKEDTDAYSAMAAAFRLPKADDAQKAARAAAILEATRGAIRTPWAVMEESLACLEALEELSHVGNRNAFSDVGVAALAAWAAVQGADLNVGINLGSLKDETEKQSLTRRCADLCAKARALHDGIAARVRAAVWG